MGVFFGTDGIRGVVNVDLTHDVAFKCGNALGSSTSRAKILIGGDTRPTRSFLSTAFSGGAMSAGANMIDVGVCPTAGVAYLTKFLKCDFGVVVSASHNPVEYNGIKIFDSDGMKIGDKKEELLERKFLHEQHNNQEELGTYQQNYDLVKYYKNYLISCCECGLDGLKVLIDGSNGASGKIAPCVFRKLGAKVVAINCSLGKEINKNCGSTHPETLSFAMKKYGADIGFAFDGDSDRVIACDENGNIIDGDMIIYVLSRYLKEKGKLKNNAVVGTRHTNMGLEKSLAKNGITLLRTDIGDKYVIARIEEEKLSLGGEQSGHIIFRDLATTGDGILSAIKIAEHVKMSGKKLSELSDAIIYPQINIDCIVRDKMRIINNEELQLVINKNERLLGEDYRIMVRVSGTESKIRIMVEGEDVNKCRSSAEEIENTIKDIDKNT